VYLKAESKNVTDTVTLPTDGRFIYVRLWSMINGVWIYNSYTYRT